MAKLPNTTTAPTGQIAPFGLRMLPDLREQIEEAARQSGRSMNAEVVARLEQSFKQAADKDAEWRLQVEIRANTVRLDAARFHLSTLQIHGEMLRQQLQSLERDGANPDEIEIARSKVKESGAEQDKLQKRIKEFLDESFRLDNALDDASKPRRERLDADAEKALQPDYRALRKSEDVLGLPDELRQIKPINKGPIPSPNAKKKLK